MKTCLRKIGIRAAAILFAASVSLALLFTACPNNAGGNTGGGIPASVSYRITFSVDGGHGTLKATAEGVAETDKSPISVEKDKTVTFIAKPDAGYKVTKWAITGGTFEAGTGTNGSLTAKVKITANTEVKVSFEELPPGSYTVKHYQEKTEGGYPAEPTGTESLSGTPETNAQYTPKTYEGFTYKPALTKVNGTVQEGGTIAADNSTVVELYYERNTVNVTFKLAGGNIGGNTNDVVRSGKYGTAFTLPADPEKTGFVFKEWNPGPPSPLVFPAADTQYTAVWAPLYIVTFSVGGTGGTLKATAEGVAETATSPISVEKGKTVTFTAAPESGYKVDKWTVTPASALQEGGTAGSTTAKVKISAATTVKVSFKELPPGSYTVKHYQEKTEGGYPAEPTGTESLSGTSGKPVAYTPKTYEGFTYKPALTKVNGIVQGTGTIAADNSTVVELFYERNTVNVTFKLAGGNIGGNTNDVVRSGKYGTALPLPVNPEKTGFAFKEWNPALPLPLVFPAADTQYTADWVPLYTVNFSVGGTGGTLKATAEGVAETATSPISVEKDKTVTFTAVPAEGYKVGTWTITPASALQEGGTSGSTTAKVKITAATTVNVSFTKNEYEVTFNAVGGTPEPAAQTVKYKEKASAPSPVPTKNGYTFKGWYNKAGNTLWNFAVNEVTQNTELYAKWRINTYTVTFSVKGTPANGTLKAEFDDTESSSGDPVDYNKTVIFTAKPATGYKVDTWTITGSSFEASTGTDGNPIAKVKITADTNVKVSFTKNEYTVTFDADGGTPAPAAQTVKYKEKASVPSEPVKEGYTFKGWHNKAGNAPWNFTVNEVTGNTELYAKWQINTYPVTFNVEGAPPNGTLKAELADSVIVSGNPVEHGKSVTFTAAPASDYKVDTWTVTPASAVQEGGTPGSLIAKVKVSSATTVKVTFKLADKTYTVNGIDFIMKSIAAVTNGSVGHVDADDNKPHTVSLSAYRIGETEVTQELWQAVMGNNPSDLYGYGSVPAKGEVQGKRPVDTVSWFECIAFCNELTKKVNGGSDAQCVYTFGGHIYSTADATAKKVPVMDMSKKGFRLPTEAEWEWAAKGGTEDKWAGTNEEAQLVNYAWYDDFYGGDAHLRTHEVKKKLPNAYGLYDMSGNVSEWCWDWYDSFPYSLPADYTGPTSGLRRTLRGGNRGEGPDSARRARRNCLYMSSGGNRVLGLRVVCRP